MACLLYDDQYVSEAIEQVNGVFLSSAAHVPSNADMTTFIPFIFSEQTLAKISWLNECPHVPLMLIIISYGKMES